MTNPPIKQGDAVPGYVRNALAAIEPHHAATLVEYIESLRPAAGEAVAWTIRRNEAEDEAGGEAYDVMRPDGKWWCCIAVGPEDARNEAIKDWNAEQDEAARYAAPAASGGEALVEWDGAKRTMQEHLYLMTGERDRFKALHEQAAPTIERMERRIAELAASGAAPVVPDGMVLVPRVPTEAMLGAYMAVAENPHAQWHTRLDRFTGAYRAMLAAAPVEGFDEGMRAEIERLNSIINTPQSGDFLRAVSIEAEHQRQRWGSSHDEGKTPADWFWLVGYLGGKALHAQVSGNAEKAEHHVITAAAACANWHRAMLGQTDMRPGIDGQAALQGGATEWVERAAVCAQSILLMLGHVESRRDYHGTSIGHYRWMAEELAAKRVGSATKACRWLGYLQGGLVHAGYTTLETEKRRNLESQAALG